jgi:hypothetical protein
LRIHSLLFEHNQNRELNPQTQKVREIKLIQNIARTMEDDYVSFRSSVFVDAKLSSVASSKTLEDNFDRCVNCFVYYQTDKQIYEILIWLLHFYHGGSTESCLETELLSPSLVMFMHSQSFSYFLEILLFYSRSFKAGNQLLEDYFKFYLNFEGQSVSSQSQLVRCSSPIENREVFSFHCIFLNLVNFIDKSFSYSLSPIYDANNSLLLPSAASINSFIILFSKFLHYFYKVCERNLDEVVNVYTVLFYSLVLLLGRRYVLCLIFLLGAFLYILELKNSQHCVILILMVF